MQCPKSKAWDTRGEIKALRYSETGQIVSYDILLPNGKLTSRHRRFITRDIPVIDDRDSSGESNDEGFLVTSAHGEGMRTSENEGSVESGHSMGVITRSRSRFIGKIARSDGKFQENDDLITDDLVTESRCADLVTVREVEPHQESLLSSGGTVEEMAGKSCVSLPFLCLTVWSILSGLVIACLSYFLHRCSNMPVRTSSQPANCIQTGASIQETNLDFLNLDISEKDIVDEAMEEKCNCSLEVLEWTLFEIVVVALLLLIFVYLSGTDGVSHFMRYLKKRNNDGGRLQRELDAVMERQNKLKMKMARTNESSAHAQAQPSNPDAAQQISAL